MVILLLSELGSLMSDLAPRTDSSWAQTQPRMAASAPARSLSVAPGRHADARLLCGGGQSPALGASSLGSASDLGRTLPVLSSPSIL